MTTTTTTSTTPLAALSTYDDTTPDTEAMGPTTVTPPAVQAPSVDLKFGFLPKFTNPDYKVRKEDAGM